MRERSGPHGRRAFAHGSAWTAGDLCSPGGAPLRKQSHAPGPAAENGAGPPRGPAACPTPQGPRGRTRKHTFDEVLRHSVCGKRGRGDKGDPAIRREGTTQGPFRLNCLCSGPLCRRLVPHPSPAPSGGGADSGDRRAPAGYRNDEAKDGFFCEESERINRRQAAKPHAGIDGPPHGNRNWRSGKKFHRQGLLSGIGSIHED